MTQAEVTSQPRALISVYDKTGIEDFAGGLVELNWQLIASGGTHRAITDAGIPALDVAEFVGGGAMLGHRVVTLSREIAAGLLADPNNERDMAEMRDADIDLIDLLCQDSYPLEKTIATPGVTPEEVLAQSDIGGPTMLREAAKGGRIVLSVPEQRQLVLDWLREGRPNETEFISELARRAVYEVARYSMIEARYWNGRQMSGFIALKHAATKYGENPQQRDAAVYADNRVNVDPLGADQFVHVQGMEKSTINEFDIGRLVQTGTHIAAGFQRNFGEVPPMAIAVKHENACGAGVAKTLAEAVEKTLAGDTRAVFGGVIMVNGVIDGQVARVLMTHLMKPGEKRFLDGVVGSSVTEEASEILSRKKLRIVVNPALANLTEDSLDTNRRTSYLRGSTIEQDNYTFVMDMNADYMEYYGEHTDQQKRDLVLAWAVGCTSNSNTVTLVKNGMVIGNGVGQQCRISAGQLAIARTSLELPTLVQEDKADELVMKIILNKWKLDGAVAYSDSFFPFRDGPTLLANAGVKAMLTSWKTEAHKNILREIHAAGVSIAMVPDEIGRGFAFHAA